MGMSKFGPIKIAVALVIAIGYLLLFGVTERVDSVDSEYASESSEPAAAGTETTEKEPVSEETSVTEQTDSVPTEITFPDYENLNIFNPLRPYENNAVVFLPIGYEDVLTEAETTAPETGADTQTEKPEETTSKAPDAVIDVTSAETAAVTTEPVTEPAQTTTEVVTESTQPSGDTLRVRYNGSGGNVEGDAADILARVVMGEIGGSFDEEAIKAQAVASYTYIKYYNNNNSTPNVAVDTPSQRVKDCVNEVLGQMIYFEDKPIQAVYSSSSAGYTASSKQVWGVDYPYLQSRKCELDSFHDPNYEVKATFTPAEIKGYVKDATGIELDGDPGTWFAIKSHVDSVYVGSLSIGGQTSYTDEDGKQVEITGRVMREKIMNYRIRSACFEITYSSDTDRFTFTTCGYGHGVGMSQNGANNLAKYWGYDYKKILEYYYPGTEVK